MDVDQASVLVPLGLPVAGAETAPNVLGKSLCSYGLMGRWGEKRREASVR
jgi:hypothetical protein